MQLSHLGGGRFTVEAGAATAKAEKVKGVFRLSNHAPYGAVLIPVALRALPHYSGDTTLVKPQRCAFRMADGAPGRVRNFKETTADKKRKMSSLTQSEMLPTEYETASISDKTKRWLRKGMRRAKKVRAAEALRRPAPRGNALLVCHRASSPPSAPARSLTGLVVAAAARRPRSSSCR